MIGISAFGIYVPAYRFSRESIVQATGGRSLGGERAVANFDEDALTMGVEASLECMDNYAITWGERLVGAKLQALLFASTSSPYREKSATSVIGSVLDMESSALLTDLSASLRGGLTGVAVGSNMLKEGSPDDKVLVVAADKRLAEPGTNEEQSFGDGAAALLLGKENVIATIEAHVAVNSNFPHFWRRENDHYVQSGDQRFVDNYGYLPLMSEAIDGLLRKTNLSAEEIAKLVVYAPNSRLAQQLARRLKFKRETQLADTLFAKIGDTGTAQVFLSLSRALTKASPGDKIIVAGYGDGAEATLLIPTENIRNVGKHRTLETYLRRGRPLLSYVKYLHFRDIVGQSTYDDAFSALPILWREERQNLKLCGTRCKKCGAINFLHRRVCHTCGARDETEEFRMSRRGRIYTYTNEYLYFNPDPPNTLAVVDLEGGGRFFGQVTDINSKDMHIGLEVELCFRKLHEGQGLPNYFWKARPSINMNIERV